MRWNLFVSFLFLGWVFSCNQVNPRDELLFTLVSGLNPVTTSTAVSVPTTAKISVSSASVTLTYGTPQNFGISLVKLPTANVTITLTFTSSKLQVNASNSPLTNVLTFTPANFNTVQTVSLSSATQILDTSSLSVTASSTDTYYNGTSGSIPINHRNVNIAYTGSSFIFKENVVAPTLTPTIQFSFTSCSVAPTLPTGLSLNTSTCVISGTPTTAQAGSTYTVTVTNGTESANQNLTIQVEPTVYKVFVTAATFNGNLQGAAANGPAGADLKCNADANKPTTGTYKAMLTTNAGARRACDSTGNCTNSGENTDWVFQFGKYYVRASDSAFLFTPNAAGILPASSSIFSTAPYTMSESFDSGLLKTYWTGLATPNFYWQVASAQVTNTCSNWTSGSATSPTSEGGRVGNSNSNDYTAFRNGASGVSCSSLNYLVCVEQ
ncbi:DUF1554 domain-containing protein [Leptospira congkakensis]|uniref:DUF1554 domain-containing protein n=1 Tax=Leptospira congkakensis TaxID=2484932 RepID=A0A4Z1A1W3_9LEPT|nr:DUF1554 domain-containing protein [Leptospira congkakensis]TGL87669.1 DUF1554 domain-containing protein [Leptospira congkakensis]TGL89715.1 DUF1554 domain-containing protein [Leptospira congkakensis]TGL95820.1 DUF1554 domain-containing protein [Leptospira congkakensis]